ncbi:Spectrin beta chain [Taenia solium]|eukprot:TsM_000539300 transcript=TsM_000539300 gene=TsM_000539300
MYVYSRELFSIFSPAVKPEIHAQERERIQKKTFTKWSNNFLVNDQLMIEDLFTDLCDGRILLRLIERVSGYKLPTPTPGRMRIHCLENVEKSLAFLDKLNVHLENIGAHDIVDGNNRIILGLIWTMILRFQVQNISVIEKVRHAGYEDLIGLRRNSTEALLLWCKAKTQAYPNVSVTNFTTSWRDGLAFNALIHKHRPDLIDFASLSPDEPLRNLHIAFTTAERCLGIAKLLDPEDVVVEEPEEKSIITYLVSYYHYFAREKANTVHARRIERVVNLLKCFINDVKDYEVSADKLMRWIEESTLHMNEASLQGNLESLQHQLVELNQFRNQEKPPHFHEKGELEVAFFVIRNKMLATGMRVYIPPKQLRISEVNRAWEVLEHCEYKLWLNLNDELRRQEMLDQLFLKFEKKCTMRESWLLENQQIVEQELVGSTRYALQIAQKRHEAFEADVFAYEDRIKLIVEIANELRRCQYFQDHRVQSRSQHVKNLWKILLETIKNRRLLIQQRIACRECDTEFDHLMKVAAELKDRMGKISPGTNFEQVQHALMQMEATDNEIKTLCTQVDNLLTKHRGGYGEELEKEWFGVADQIMLLAEEKRREIELVDLQWHLLPEVSRYKNYVLNRMRFIEAMEFKLSYNAANRIHRQVRYIEEDVTKEQSQVNLIEELFGGSIYNHQLHELAALWRSFNEILSSLKSKAVFIGDVLFLNGEFDDAENWIAEKIKIVELEDSSVESSVHLNQKLLEEVEVYLHVIEHINEEAMTLKESCKSFDTLPHDSTETFNAKVLIQSLVKVRNEIERILVEKPEGVLRSYLAIADKVKKKQASLIDALSIQLFTHNSNQARAWVADKSSLLARLKRADLNAIYEKGISADLQEEFDFVERRFEEIENQMSDMAEQVANLNRTASNIVDAATIGNFPDAKAVLSQVTWTRNQLNDAWNQLADQVEDCRYRLNLDHAFLNLCQDCFYTNEWIKEKLTVLSRHNWTYIPSVSHFSRLRIVLKSLKSDAKVIRAKVDDIGERITNSYHVSDGLSNERGSWLFKEHDALSGKLAGLDRQLDQCESLLTLHGGHLQSAQSLGEFLQWVLFLKDKNSCISIPSNLEEIRASVCSQEQDLQELLTAEGHLEELLAGYEKVYTLMDTEKSVKESRVNPEQVIEEYAETCDLVRKNIINLNQSIAIQDLLTELGGLEAAVYQQDAYLNQKFQPESLEAVENALKCHEAFVSSMLTCCNRFNALERKSRETLTGDHGIEGRFFAKTNSLRQKLEDNEKRAYELERCLKENLRLQELLNDFADIEDWMSEKLVALNRVTLTSKRDVSNAYSQVKALQEEIEASRERAEGIIEAGKQLIDSCPRVSRVVSVSIDNMYVHWEALLKELHKQMLKYLLNKTVQDLLRWAEKLLSKVKTDIEGATLTTEGLTELQQRLDSHRRDCQSFENYSEMADVIKEHTESLSQRHPDRATDLAAVNTEVDKQLHAVNAALAQREDLLNLHITVTSHLLDLNSELLWVKDKLVQIRQPYNDWTPQDRWSVGKHLLRVQQENRRLMNYIAEVENRGPRRVKETYLGTSENAAQRVGSFREVLGELEQAWYTVTHLLEVRREELRLAEGIHKFFFDVVNMEAWISERELYLQSICEPTNIEEANRSLRRLNVLHETVKQWSNEVTKTERRANELCAQLSSGVQINGNCVIAPPGAKSAVVNTISRLVKDFARLESSVRDCRKDLVESIGLHDLMQDIKDLEDWIAERQKTAKDSDVGADLEHTFNLKDRFDQFAKCTRREGERRVKTMVLRIDQIIAKGHKNRSEIALAKDGLNEDWADLLEMITTRGQLLKSALMLYRFFSDAQYLEKQIGEFYQYLPEEPTVEMVTDQLTSVGGRGGGIASLQRRQAGVQQRLSHLNSSCAALAATAFALQPTYSGEEEVRLRLRRDCVLSAARSLAATAEVRARQLEEAQHFHRFFSTAHSLISWFAEAKDKMSQPNGLSRTIHGVERLIAEHRQLYAEMGIKVKQVEECLDVGRAILGIGTHSTMDEAARPATSRLHAVLTAPQGEVRETCVTLATERILIEALWRERWERLGMLLDIRYYMRDAAAAESWLVSREVYLVSVRRNIGETLAETLALLGAHYAFERACASAEERFAALKQLTKMEIHALEWKPEDASRHEKQRRDNIRRAVHEFLPPSDSFTRLPPQPMPSRGQSVAGVGTSKEPGLFESNPAVTRSMVTQSVRTSFPPPAPFERATGVIRTVPIPQKRTSRASLSAVTVPKSTLVHQEEPLRPLSSSSTANIFFPRRARVTPPKNPSDEPATSTTPFEEAEEGKTLDTTSSTRPQGSFPSTSANTPPPETHAEAAEPETTLPTSMEEIPRVEGPLIRKWESEAGGIRHSRGRGWTSVYVTLIDGKLTFYRDRRTRREHAGETFHGEAPMDLSGAIAVPALDYTKRPFVFRLRLFTGAEYLFQAVSAEVLQRWTDAINDSASKLTQRESKNTHERAHSLPPSSRHSRASSAASGQMEGPQKRRHSSLRRILKRT